MTHRNGSRVIAPAWGQLPTLALVLCVLVAPIVPWEASAQPKKTPGKIDPKPAPATKPAGGPTKPGPVAPPPTGKQKPGGEKTFDFNALDLNGRMRTPQLLYFLERANEELERASLEKRSFIPHIVRTVEEEPL